VFEEVWEGMGGVLQEGSVGHCSWYLLNEHCSGIGKRRF
jgi:hypothetical protein